LIEGFSLWREGFGFFPGSSAFSLKFSLKAEEPKETKD
jgi:hypothetical protein